MPFCEREKLQSGVLTLLPVSSKAQLAEFFTKAIAPTPISTFISKLRMINIHGPSCEGMLKLKENDEENKGYSPEATKAVKSNVNADLVSGTDTCARLMELIHGVDMGARAYGREKSELDGIHGM